MHPDKNCKVLAPCLLVLMFATLPDFCDQALSQGGVGCTWYSNSDLIIKITEVKLTRDIFHYNGEVFGVNSNKFEISLQKRVEYLNMKSTPAKQYKIKKI